MSRSTFKFISINNFSTVILLDINGYEFPK